MRKETKETIRQIYWCLSFGLFVVGLGISGITSTIYFTMSGETIDALLAVLQFIGVIWLLKNFDRIVQFCIKS